jgi:hypothetical protein
MQSQLVHCLTANCTGQNVNIRKICIPMNTRKDHFVRYSLVLHTGYLLFNVRYSLVLHTGYLLFNPKGTVIYHQSGWI